MNFRQSLTYLDSFANLEKITLHADNRLLNLERMRYLLALLGHPQKSFFPVLIAGTKGKGSTGFFLQSILTAAGISSGFYNSPHLETPLERIRLNGRMIAEKTWANLLSLIHNKLQKSPVPKKMGEVTYFEVMTLLAILAFQKQKVKVGILEVGLGGRLDATNAVDAELSLVTTLGFDHEAFLGNTLAKISAEKAGIFRLGAAVFSAPQKPEAWRVLEQKAKKLKARLQKIAPQKKYKTALPGPFQKINSALAVKAAFFLAQRLNFKISEKEIREGLKAGDWPGRVEVFSRNPEFVLDGAHNPESAEALKEAVLQDLPPCKNLLVFGVARDKNAAAMLKTLRGLSNEIILTRSPNPRSQDISVLMTLSKGLFQNVIPVPRPQDAFRLAAQMAGKKDRVVVTGSFYLAGDARNWLRKGH